MTAGDNGIGGTEGTGGIGTTDNFLEINTDVRQGFGGVTGALFAFDTAAGLGHTDGIFLTEVKRAQDTAAALGGTEIDGTNALQVNTVDTKGDATLATASGSIRDARNNGAGDDAADVFANTINLFAVGAASATRPLAQPAGQRQQRPGGRLAVLPGGRHHRRPGYQQHLPDRD
jgi:hypothetical protein